jgi:hypothetical protein
METLFVQGRIINEDYGRKGDHRKRIAPVETPADESTEAA